MSSILAIFNRNQQPIEKGTLEGMLAASSHPAPDGARLWQAGHIALGHQHFWITPEEVGEEQPLVDQQGFAITCDARLDNRASLIALLRLDQQGGQALSDATLILMAYRRWGANCVAYLLGDFAFVIWDASEQQFFMARDSSGLRPLRYYLDGECLLVASQIKQLLAHPAVEPRLNVGKVADYLAVLSHNQADTFYQDIYNCPPAHCLLISAHSVRKWRYWDIDPSARIRYRDDKGYAEHFLELLTEAITCRLRTHHQVGISLSGGLDSTSLAALASRTSTKGSLKSFSYLFDELPSCDERAYIEPVVARYELEATYILADDKWPLHNLNKWPLTSDYVTDDPYIWLPLSIAQAAKQADCPLLISGHVGDSLFTGARYWAAEQLYELRWGSLLSMIYGSHADFSLYQNLIQNGLYRLLPTSLKQSYRNWRLKRQQWQDNGLHPALIKQTGLLERAFPKQGWQTFTRPSQWERYQSLMLSGWDQRLPIWRDMHLAHQVEPVVPFWDRRLIEYVMALPADQLGHPPWTKYVLRQAMTNHLPPSVRQRRDKTALYALFDRGLFEHEAQTIKKLFANSQLVERKFMRAEWLAKEIEARPDKWQRGGFLLWLAISLELWLQKYWS